MSENKTFTVRVIVNIDVDLEEISFPKDENGALMWTPYDCITDYISHGLFKGHDINDAIVELSMSDGFEFKDWTVEFPENLQIEMRKIMIRNMWNNPQMCTKKTLQDDYASLDEAIIEQIEKMKKDKAT